MECDGKCALERASAGLWRVLSGGCKASPVAGKDLLYVGMSGKSHASELGLM